MLFGKKPLEDIKKKVTDVKKKVTQVWKKFPTEDIKKKLSKIGDSKVTEYSKDSITLETGDPEDIRKALKVLPDGKDPYPFKPSSMDMSFRLRVLTNTEDDLRALLEKITKLIVLKPEIDFSKSKKRVEIIYKVPQIKLIDIIYETMFKNFSDRIYWSDAQIYYQKPEKKSIFLMMERPIPSNIVPLVPESKKEETKSDKPKEEKETEKKIEEKDTRNLDPKEYAARIDTLVNKINQLKNEKQRDLRSLENALNAILKQSSLKVASLYLKRFV